MATIRKVGVYTDEINIGNKIKIVSRSYVMKENFRKLKNERLGINFDGWVRMFVVQDGKRMEDGIYFWDYKEVWAKFSCLRSILDVLSRRLFGKLFKYSKDLAKESSEDDEEE